LNIHQMGKSAMIKKMIASAHLNSPPMLKCFCIYLKKGFMKSS